MIDGKLLELCVNHGVARDMGAMRGDEAIYKPSFKRSELEEFPQQTIELVPQISRIIDCYRDVEERWRFKAEDDGMSRFRNDKSDRNHISTVIKVTESINDGVSTEDLHAAEFEIKKGPSAEDPQPLHAFTLADCCEHHVPVPGISRHNRSKTISNLATRHPETLLQYPLPSTFFTQCTIIQGILHVILDLLTHDVDLIVQLAHKQIQNMDEDSRTEGRSNDEVGVVFPISQCPYVGHQRYNGGFKLEFVVSEYMEKYDRQRHEKARNTTSHSHNARTSSPVQPPISFQHNNNAIQLHMQSLPPSHHTIKSSNSQCTFPKVLKFEQRTLTFHQVLNTSTTTRRFASSVAAASTSPQPSTLQTQLTKPQPKVHPYANPKSTTMRLAQQLDKFGVTETYAAYGSTEKMSKECIRQADYSIPAAITGNRDAIPKTAEGEELGVALEGSEKEWWYDGA
ncbi:hypothetical protein M501DRAFT_987003 [Patellaria atrata CBS 101060]|uniref:mRNA capping enzyme C-terminal domain-containing protein n=1 Tax=Patellaria atrata CBS 101060 TaxID=1346257 RepID=A0A9P4S7L4_9PEZI|nr:hypothetical protein M501DRAFT_987003 [Patellaria atrata CBS 101060]